MNAHGSCSVSRCLVPLISLVDHSVSVFEECPLSLPFSLRISCFFFFFLSFHTHFFPTTEALFLAVELHGHKFLSWVGGGDHKSRRYQERGRVDGAEVRVTGSVQVLVFHSGPRVSSDPPVSGLPRTTSLASEGILVPWAGALGGRRAGWPCLGTAGRTAPAP